MPMKRVLLTGASTLTGCHIIDQLLPYNVSIRAVVGSRDEALALAQQYSSKSNGRLDFAIVPVRDQYKPGAYNNTLASYPQPFDTVIHTVWTDACGTAGADCLSRFINLEIEHLLSFLQSIREVAPKVQRVILTTSLTPFARWLVEPDVLRSPRGGNTTSMKSTSIDADYILATSQASNNIVHDRLWKWTKDNRARFDLVALTAPSVYGPSIRAVNNSADFEDANRRIWNICSSDPSEDVSSPPYGIDYFTDARDLAYAHVQAVFNPEARNKRFVISAGAMPSRTVIADYLRSHFPDLGRHIQRTPRRAPTSNDSTLEGVDPHLAASVLGLSRYRPLDDTLSDLARQISELHRRRDWRRVSLIAG